MPDDTSQRDDSGWPGAVDVHPDSQAPANDVAFRHDAFVSYSHAVDGALAPKLQRHLRRFARPYPRAARTIFRDETGLKLTEALWPDIEKAIKGSRRFVLLASPESAKSEWVQKEVDYWLTLERGLPLLVVTSGSLSWERRDTLAPTEPLVSDALSHLLTARYAVEPKWADLRNVVRRRQLGRFDPRYHQALAALVADIDGVTLEEVLDLDRWYRWIAVSIVLITVLAISVLGVSAWWRGREAERQAEQVRQAAIIARAEALGSTDPTRAVLVLAEADPDAFPLRLLRTAAALSAQTFTTHWNAVPRLAVTSMVGSPDGRTIVSGSLDGIVRVSPVDRLESWVDRHDGRTGIRLLNFSPNGAFFVTASDDRVARIWEVDSTTPPRRLESHEGPITNVLVSPDSRYVATTSVNRIRLWDVSDTAKPAVVFTMPTAITAVSFSPDGTLFAAAGSENGVAMIWRVGESEPLIRLRIPGIPNPRKLLLPPHLRSSLEDDTAAVSITAMVFDSDHSLFTGSLDGSIRTWSLDVATRTAAVRVLTGHTGAITSLARSSNGILVSGSADGTLRVWDSRRDWGSIPLDGHRGQVNDVRLDDQARRVLTASSDGVARIWHLGGSPIPQTLRGHTGAVGRAIFAEGGRAVVTASTDGTIRSWAVEAADTTLVLKGANPGYGVRQARFSDDGSLVATGSGDGSVRVWSTATAKLVRSFETDSPIEQLSVDPGNMRVFATNQQGHARAWNLHAGHEDLRLTPGPVMATAMTDDETATLTAYHSGILTFTRSGSNARPVDLPAIAAVPIKAEISVDGKYGAVLSREGTVTVFTTDGADVTPIPRVVPLGTRLLFGPLGCGGRTLAMLANGDASFWRVSRGQVLLVHQDTLVKDISMPPEARRALMVHFDGKVSLLDLETGAASALTAQPIRQVVSGALSSSGRLVALAAPDGQIAVFEPTARTAPRILRYPLTPGTIAFSAQDDKIAVSGNGDRTLLWNLASDGAPVPLETGGTPSSVAFSRNGATLAIAIRHNIQIWSSSGTKLADLRSAEREIGTVAYSSNGQSVIARGLDDGSVVSWPLAGSGEPRRIGAHVGLLARELFNDDGTRLLATTARGDMRAWGPTERGGGSLIGHMPEGALVGFNRNNSGVLSLHADGLRLWSLSRPMQPVLLAVPSGLEGARFSPDATRIVGFARDGLLYMFRSDDPSTSEILRGHRAAVRDVAFGPNRTLLASASADRTARLWFPETSRDPLVFNGHEQVLNSVSFNPDGTMLATASDDTTVRLWPVDGREPAVVLTGHSGPVLHAAFSSTGDRLVTSSTDGTARVWLTRPAALIDKIRTRTRLCLTMEDRQLMLGESVEDARSKSAACASNSLPPRVASQAGPMPQSR